MTSDTVMKKVNYWLHEIVIGLSLCPFAKSPFKKGTIHYCISEAKNDEEKIEELIVECRRLDADKTIETSLLIYPERLGDFFDYTQFIAWGEKTLKRHSWEGVYQIATFHPQYQFTHTENDAASNYTNRAPYPMIHLLRESSLQEAIETFPDTTSIPEKNIKKMENLSQREREKLFFYLFSNHR